MRPGTRIVAAASVVLAPLTFGVADHLRMISDPPQGVGMVNPDYGVEAAAATLANIQANPGPFAAAGWLDYAGTLLAVPALLTIWWLTVGRAPRWAWAGAVLAGLGVVGNTVHLALYYGLSQVAAGAEDLTAAAAMIIAAEEHAFMLALFVPFMVGLVAVIPQVVGLRRARVLPLWAVLAVVAATALMLVTGSVPWASALHTGLLVAGFAPAALRLLRGGAAAERRVVAEPVPA